MLSVTPRTDPSPISAWTLPGCRLRAEWAMKLLLGFWMQGMLFCGWLADGPQSSGRSRAEVFGGYEVWNDHRSPFVSKASARESAA